MPKSTRPLNARSKTQIRSQLVEKARQKHIAQEFARAEIELSRNIEFAPGYAPPLAGLAVTDGAAAPPALIVALGPGEPELVPAAALEALRRGGQLRLRTTCPSRSRSR